MEVGAFFKGIKEDTTLDLDNPITEKELDQIEIKLKDATCFLPLIGK